MYQTDFNNRENCECVWEGWGDVGMLYFLLNFSVPKIAPKNEVY